ncbi:ketoacyl-ACP synthase III [Polynucleobacter sp. AP-Feld-500C-C5]|uniref:ketoacyl-ACP synthase III n=1 Tax=Polynucleobacter sp. AP-Feld-500C-C5 TaxID=2576924 RepID=UPI001C0ACFEB|nr:ketoacyl-ACP synthase III [Polynucleobacter sp. AP-Feld-500C-C5]MBU3633169.1 ketoacyl-ACP synthase III [Polynucleobacter sp. AP-Feld-500C-C5]
MAIFALQNVRISGIASVVPKRVISNIEDCHPALQPERERLVRNIGILNRRIMRDWECFSDYALVAAEAMIKQLGWAKEDVDALIVVTQSPDYLLPSTAIILQDRLGLSSKTIAFDINLGCSGFPFGIHVIGSMIASGSIRKALLVIGDKSASMKSPLFSDAASVTALEFDQRAKPMYFDLNSDGSGFKAIYKPVGGHREPYATQHSIPVANNNGLLTWPDEVILDGPEIMNFSISTVPKVVMGLLEFANVKKEEIDYFIFHQANKMINETIRKKLDIPIEKVPSTLLNFGNTSSASLPLTITVEMAKELNNQSKKVLGCGFGVGLSWGTFIADIDNAICPPLIEF